MIQSDYQFCNPMVIRIWQSEKIARFILCIKLDIIQKQITEPKLDISVKSMKNCERYSHILLCKVHDLTLLYLELKTPMYIKP